jgi:predicted ATP-grasp superfamily ATP-dependent carboligase
MPPRCLLVATTTNWLGTARIPRGLARAGFSVSLLTPRKALAEASRFVDSIGYVPDQATPADWHAAFANMAEAVAPRLVVPCDDMAFRLLARVKEPFAALIRTSLGDPAHFLRCVDKTQLPPLAEALGVRVPPHAVVTGAGETDSFVATHGLPAVLKRGHGFAGQGVAICNARAELGEALARFSAMNRADPLEPGASRHLLQGYVAGRIQYFHAVAWNGTLRAGWALEKLVAHPHPTGPPTVTRYFHSSRLESITRTLIAGLGMSGFLFAEFIVDDKTGEPYLLEVNRRVSPATHRGEARNVDLCAALFAAVNDSPPASRSRLDDGEEGISVHFPQEWLRDPDSRWLAEHPSDVPWDEPELLAAMLAMRHA